MEDQNFPLYATDAARRAQLRQGWSDRMLLAQCLTHLLTYRRSCDDERARRIADDLRALPEDASDADRITVVTRGLEVCWGYVGSEWLDGTLERQPALTPERAEAVIAGFTDRYAQDRGPLTDPRIHLGSVRLPLEERRARRRQALLIVGATWIAMVALAVVVVLVTG